MSETTLYEIAFWIGEAWLILVALGSILFLIDTLRKGWQDRP